MVFIIVPPGCFIFTSFSVKRIVLPHVSRVFMVQDSHGIWPAGTYKFHCITGKRKYCRNGGLPAGSFTIFRLYEILQERYVQALQIML